MLHFDKQLQDLFIYLFITNKTKTKKNKTNKKQKQATEINEKRTLDRQSLWPETTATNKMCNCGECSRNMPRVAPLKTNNKKTDALDYHSHDKNEWLFPGGKKQNKTKDKAMCFVFCN